MSEPRAVYDLGGRPVSRARLLSEPSFRDGRDPRYAPPTPEVIRAVFRMADWTQAEVATRLRVDVSTVRRWMAKHDDPQWRAFPYGSWRLLLLEAGLVTLVSDDDRARQYLAAWRAGVALAGSAYFQVGAPSFVPTTDQPGIEPNFEAIGAALPSLEPGQRHFLIALCQFHSDSEIAALCHEHEVPLPTLADLARLDEPSRAIIVRLLSTCTG